MDNPDFRIIYLFTDLLAPLIVGYLLYRRGMISDDLIRRILRLNVIVIYTILALMSCWTLPISWDLALIPVYGILIVLFPGFIGWAFFIRKYHNPLDRGAFLCNAMMSNITTLGGVCAYIIYGEQGFGYAQIMGIFQTILLVLAVFPMAQFYCLQHENHGGTGKVSLRVRDILLSWNQLSILGMAAGLLLNIGGFARPPVLSEAFSYIIHVSAWFAMLPVGSLINIHRARHFFYLTADMILLRFLIVPLVTYAAAQLFIRDPIVQNALVIFASVPAAINATLTARLYRLNVDYTIAVFLVTTILYLTVLFPVTFFLFR